MESRGNFDLCFPLQHDIDLFFIFFLAMYLLWKNVFSSLWPIYHWDSYLCCWVVKVLYSDASSFLDMIWKYFPHVVRIF